MLFISAKGHKQVYKTCQELLQGKKHCHTDNSYHNAICSKIETFIKHNCTDIL